MGESTNMIKNFIISASICLSFANCSTISLPKPQNVSRVNITKFARESIIFIESVHTLVEKTENGNVELQTRASNGSGSIIYHGKDFSLTLTAAHVCTIINNRQKITMFPEYRHLVDSTEVTTANILTDIHGNEYKATPVIWNKTHDTCILMSSKIPLHALNIANDERLEIGKKYYNLAFPRAIWAKNFVPSFEGVYIGDFEEGIFHASSYSMPAAPGSSGSPILNDRGQVVGVLHSAMYNFEYLALAATPAQTSEIFHLVQEFLKQLQAMDNACDIKKDIIDINCKQNDSNLLESR